MTTKKSITASGPIGLLHPLLTKPQKIPFGKLQVAPERFQVRNPEACNYVQGVLLKKQSSEIATELHIIIENGEELDPIILWKDPLGSAFLIDGHHRVEAMQDAGISPKDPIWVQFFTGESEAEAIMFSLDLNKRLHLNLHPAEAIEAYWRMLLCGETAGSVRERASRFQISKSTVQRMDQEFPSVIAELQKLATKEEVTITRSFIRTRAPLWKERSIWREAPEKISSEAMQQKTIEKILRIMTLKLTDDAKSQPEVVLEAFQEFFQTTTGRTVIVSTGTQEDFSRDF